MKTLGGVLVLLCVTAMLGCAAPNNRLYSGDALPPEKIGILTAPTEHIFDAKALIRSIDGTAIERSKWDGKAQVELLPGAHVVRIGMLQSTIGGTRFSRTDQVVRFKVEAGHVYEARVVVSTDGGDNRWDAKIIDTTTGTTYGNQ